MIENEEILTKISEEKNLSFVLDFDEKTYQIQRLSIEKSKIPVRKPTTRGGVYFTDTTAYKVKAITNDLSITKEIPKLMLGPNADFKPIRITTRLRINDTDNLVIMTTHLTNATSMKETVELNLIVDRVESK